MTYGITGSTGSLGKLVIQHLLNLKIPASSIIALARDELKAKELGARGVQVRIGEYGDKASLEKAFAGVDRLLLISGTDFGQRVAQHQNTIEAAKAAGVTTIVYTSICHADTSTNVLAPEHKATEAILKSSGLQFTILRNNWYTENYANDLKFAKQTGMIGAAVGSGKVASASRVDYAEAAAKVLISKDHAGKTYELSGSQAWDFPELARTFSELLNKEIVFKNLSPQERRQNLLQAGLPPGIADFLTALDKSVADGTLAFVSKDLEILIGHKPQSLKEGLQALLN